MSYKHNLEFVIVRSSESGVWFGRMSPVGPQLESGTISLLDARKVWSWEGANATSGLASKGPSGGKICAAVSMVVIRGFCEIIECSDDAIAAFDKVEPW